MASRYSIVQYVPNPIADERINIGVVAFDEEHVRVQFLKNWSRVQAFGGESINFLKEFAQRMNEAAGEGLLFPGDRQNDTPKHERLQRIALSSMNSIQFTEPRGSLEDVESLLEDIAQTYLVNFTAAKHRRDRQEAARITKSLIKKALTSYDDRPSLKDMLKSSFPIKGSYKPHKFDAVVANGKPYLAAHGISFEVQIPEDRQDSIAWMIYDVKKSEPELPIGIVALPPKPEWSDYAKLNKMYRNSISTYRSLGAEILQEDLVESWASDTIERLVLM